ncbi:hypothetical protein BaOVIS_031130 [Babesia ovis]|uniref:Uncharacterized protein n=1 Tax=Babesia ovis TaxID=5869 RepID=A0A9W5WWA1_BABOV|nr:hypothetical protein BaOVIS_031130 [Babesia ovis]
MFELLLGILDVRQGAKSAHRILVAGDDAAACSALAERLSSIHDFKTIVVEVQGNTTSSASEANEKATDKTGPHIARVPLECVFVEIRRRNWYRGCILDFFTSPGSIVRIDDTSDMTIISDVRVIIYVTSYAKYRTGFRSAVGFFRENQDCVACKILVIDMSVYIDTESIDAESELMRLADAINDICMYKINMDDEVRSALISRTILDEAVDYLIQCEST